MATYSSSHKIVFYHIPKCSGLYIESLLLNLSDFVTYNFNYESDISFYCDRDKGLRQEFYNNSDCFLILRDDIYKCFEFSFVRNPYTRFISAWAYCVGSNFENDNIIFGSNNIDTLQNCIDNRDLITSQSYFHIFKTQYMNIKGSRKLNFVGRFENLISDLRFVFNKLNLPTNFSTKKINENPIKYGDYRQYYTQEILEFVNDWFKEDFEEFNYSQVQRVGDLPKK